MHPSVFAARRACSHEDRALMKGDFAKGPLRSGNGRSIETRYIEVVPDLFDNSAQALRLKMTDIPWIRAPSASEQGGRGRPPLHRTLHLRGPPVTGACFTQGFQERILSIAGGSPLTRRPSAPPGRGDGLRLRRQLRVLGEFKATLYEVSGTPWAEADGSFGIARAGPWDFRRGWEILPFAHALAGRRRATTGKR